jgi:putative ABC transport system permease protein
VSGLESLARELGYTRRVFLKARGLIASALLSLAAGVGLGTAVLTLYRAILLRPSAFTDQAPVLAPRDLGFRAGWTDAVRTLPQLQDAALEVLLRLLFALSLALALIAAVNLAVLLLAVALSRRHEVAVRRVLGARRAVLARQLGREGGVLAATGVLAGALLGVPATVWPAGPWPTDPPPWASLHAVGPVLAAVAGAYVAVTVVFWLSALLGGLGKNLRGALGAGGRATGSRMARLLHDLLVVVQFATSLVLLVVAALLLRSYAGGRDDGSYGVADPGGVRIAELRLPPGGDAERARALRGLLARVGSLPGVRQAGVATTGAWVGLGTVDEANAYTGTTDPLSVGPVQYHAVTPGFFAALGTRVLAGREFTAADSAGSLPVAVVNLAFVYQMKMAGPVGKRVQPGRLKLLGRWYRVVGVVENVRSEGLGSGTLAMPALYFSALQHPPAAGGLAVRGGAPAALRSAVERAVPGARVGVPATLAERWVRFQAPLRWFGVLFGVLGAAALLLAASGMYAGMSFNVRRRTREIGVRMALGARTRHIVRMVVRQGARLAVRGTLLGVWVALPVARAMQIQFYGIHPLDPRVYGIVAALLATVTILASLRPARRATRVDPSESLRDE